MLLTNEDILKRIDKLTLLMLQVSPSLICEHEVIAVEKIGDRVKRYLDHKAVMKDSAISISGKHMKWLNMTYKDYKYRKDLDGDIMGEQTLNYRRWDLLFTEDKHDELMYKLRHEYIHSPDDYNSAVKETKDKIKQLKEIFEELGIEFDTDDIMRIRISKKPGDLVMVENPFDDNHSFPAVVTEAKLETMTDTSRCVITYGWFKQDDTSVIGSSTLTEYDIQTNGTLFAEEVSNLT